MIHYNHYINDRINAKNVHIHSMPLTTGNTELQNNIKCWTGVTGWTSQSLSQTGYPLINYHSWPQISPCSIREIYTSSIRVRFSMQLRQQIFAKVPEWEASISNSETKVPWEVVTKPSAWLQTNGFFGHPCGSNRECFRLDVPAPPPLFRGS